MAEDHLDKETTVSFDLTERGAKAGAKSRFVAAVDRLGGNLLELLNAPMERRIKRQRAIGAGEEKLVAELAQYGVNRLKHDPDFAERAAQQHLTKISKAQANTEAVLIHALEDLRHEPPTEAEATGGGSELSSEFTNRFERIVEAASTEELQQRWGRVLAKEVRRPGTFSAKALRVVDELEPETALMFERLCGSRLHNVLPKCLVGELAFSQVAALTGAGLVVEPGLTGQVRRFVEATTTGGGASFWVIGLGATALAIPQSAPIPATSDDTSRITKPAAVPELPVYVLTDVGHAVSSILPSREPEALLRLVTRLREMLPGVGIQELGLSPEGTIAGILRQHGS